MKFEQYLKEGYTTRNLLSHIPPENISKKPLKAGVKSKINKGLQKVLKKTYFKAIPLDEMFKVLEKEGVVPLQEDNTYWSGLLIGGSDKTQMVNFNLGWANEFQKVHGIKMYQAIPNSTLNMSYYKMPSGKYEVIGYVG